MNILQTQSCPECQASLVDDIQNGEIICSGCGVVVAEQMVDYGPETKSANLEDRMKLARATGQTTYSQHDLGITTEISISTKDFSGKTINHQVANQMHNLRKWQQRVRVSSPRERRLANVLSKLGETCDGLNLSKNVLETASMIYRNLDGHVEVKGKSVASITAATIYMACKQCDVVRSLEEICRGICAPKDVKSKTKLAAKYYRTMVMEMGHVNAPVVTMDKYISKIANMTQTEVRVERLALEIAEKTKGSSIADGKAPNGIAAAYLYVASVLLGQNVLQRDVSSIAGVTEVTIRNRCKEILTYYKLKITLRPSLAKF
ncbi:transcription initiation factor IIB [Candidatus Nitrosarchaeum limnium]|jgi:transcription initiation factor TFIIB|uniref:Transcription initiation factor IIB n=2 Tax=Candidatus Nitrosarchaeum limnium TaxID=1007084 RepID=S2EHU2_9ARCH|nr:TFIIB-type zinc ribbon-containing protein [Candidatus Nitrosarchaeum limnium]EGG43019.1 zinc finger TFIIB-type domain-containing protein [Candidatus Nitrosarchaeum limnium SFB1]EPA04337.1 transcription factor TFIIB repeat protein [Candidatus Nitrosarchaeum limnium BG20]